MPHRQAASLATMVTTTTYGMWLPGDLRGYVNDGVIVPGDARVFDRSRRLLKRDPVYLREAEQKIALAALGKAADEFGYTLFAASVDALHMHWLIAHGTDAVSAMAGRLKTLGMGSINQTSRGMRHGATRSRLRIRTNRRANPF